MSNPEEPKQTKISCHIFFYLFIRYGFWKILFNQYLAKAADFVDLAEAREFSFPDDNVVI